MFSLGGIFIVFHIMFQVSLSEVVIKGQQDPEIIIKPCVCTQNG